MNLNERHISVVYTENNTTPQLHEDDLQSLLEYNVPVIEFIRESNFFSINIEVYLLRPKNGVYDVVKNLDIYASDDIETYNKLIKDTYLSFTDEDKENIKLFLLHRKL